MHNSQSKSGDDDRKNELAAAEPAGAGEGTGEPALSSEQEIAIQALAAGKSLVVSAQAAGVARMTLYRWLRSDPAFTAAYNAWQREMLETAKARLVALTDGAVTAVGEALSKGDAKTALAVLKSLGLMKPVEVGPTDLEEAEWSMLQEPSRKASRMRDAEFRALEGK